MEFVNFMGVYSNIMSVVGRGRNEMATVHLAKTYCVPSVLYG